MVMPRFPEIEVDASPDPRTLFPRILRALNDAGVEESTVNEFRLNYTEADDPIGYAREWVSVVPEQPRPRYPEAIVDLTGVDNPMFQMRLVLTAMEKADVPENERNEFRKAATSPPVDVVALSREWITVLRAP